MTSNALPTLSKSRFTVGLQCHKRLWLEVHEREAPELVPGEAQQAIFDRGHLVGEVAREHLAGGILIDRPYYEIAERVRDTRAALDARSPAIYEASFFEDGVFVAVDVLERQRRGFTLVEVKSTTKVKEQHLPDVAVQLYVLRKAGLHIARAEVMHLNRGCRAPNLDDLFTRADVTDEVEALQSELPKQIKSLRSMLAKPMPEVDHPLARGRHVDGSCDSISALHAHLPQLAFEMLHVRFLHRKHPMLLDQLGNTQERCRTSCASAASSRSTRRSRTSTRQAIAPVSLKNEIGPNAHCIPGRNRARMSQAGSPRSGSASAAPGARIPSQSARRDGRPTSRDRCYRRRT